LEPAVTIPPEGGHHSTGGVGERVQGVTGGVRHEFWPDPFKKQRPKDNVQPDFTELRRDIPRAQAEPLMQPEDRWQRTWDQPAIVKV
jgi:hypothetical protein